jgi:hypothetical protein
MKHRQPIIIIGMHRSGTSMIVRLLEQMGLFTGKHLEANHESIFFQDANQYLLRTCEGSWDQPVSIDMLRTYPEIWDMVMSYLHHMMNSRHVVAYLGWYKFLRYGTPTRLDIPWGWKDPRSTYTLPAWLEIFPEARVIHIYRHGVDVAGSLKTRNEQVIAQKGDRYGHADRLPRLRKREGFIPSLRCSSLEGGFALWEGYFQQAREQLQRLGDRAIEIRYEDFVDAPLPILTRLSEFCRLNCPRTVIEQAVAKVTNIRALAFKREPEMVVFANGVKDRLQAAGY